jgi:hypothetical protein
MVAHVTLLYVGLHYVAYVGSIISPVMALLYPWSINNILLGLEAADSDCCNS